jgi:hypothetical protein
MAQGPRPSGIYQTAAKMLSRMNTNPQNRPDQDIALYCLYPSEKDPFSLILRPGNCKPGNFSVQSSELSLLTSSASFAW